MCCLCFEIFLSAAFGNTPWTLPLWSLFVLWLAVRPASNAAFFCILITGLVGDVLSGAPLGTYASSGLMLYLIALQVTGRLQMRTLIGRATLGALGGVLTVLISAVVIRLGGAHQVGPRLAELFVPSLTMMALSAPLLLPLFTVLESVVRPRADVDRI